MTNLDGQAEPEVVYHYTSAETLLKIVDSRTVWATNIRYLNDVLEREHFLSSVRERVRSIPPHSPLDADLFRRLLEDSDAERPFFDLPFVASFCQDRDSLPQWRSYCPSGNGVCIGFASESLRNAQIQNTGYEKTGVWPSFATTFGPVRYLAKDDEKAIDEFIDSAKSEASYMEKVSLQMTEYLASHDNGALVGGVEGNELATYDAEASSYSTDKAEFFYIALDKIASRTKHISFSSEKEHRLLVTLHFGAPGLVRYRSSRSTLIPYVPVSIPDPQELPPSHEVPKFRFAKPYFIDSVTIGPTPHPNLSADAVAGLFSGRPVHVQIYKSEVPFRDW